MLTQFMDNKYLELFLQVISGGAVYLALSKLTGNDNYEYVKSTILEILKKRE